MPVLLCAATEFEIQPTIEFVTDNKLKDIEILITGIGLMAATYQLTKAICLKKPKFILQAGVAGSLDGALPLGKVVVVANETIGDLGVEESGSFKSLFNLNLNDKNSFPWTNGKLCNHTEIVRHLNLPAVDSVSVNEISTNAQRIDYYKNGLGAAVESMEGAALHYVSLCENIPFLQIRSLSNFVGERDKSRWKIKEAIVSLNQELQKIILKLLNT